MPTDLAIEGGRSQGVVPPADAGVAEFLPQALRRDLSADQLVAIERAARTWVQARGRDLPVDIRFSLPFLSRRIFVSVLAGGERRSQSRRDAERRRRPLAGVANVLFLVGLVALLNCGLLIAALALSGILE